MSALKKRSLKHALIFLAVGLFLVGKGITWAWVFVVIAALKWIGWLNDPRRKLDEMIYRDAAVQDCQVPRDMVTYSRLVSLYEKYRRSCSKYPQLADNYREIITSMWMELGGVSDVNRWRQTVKRVADDWPLPFDDKGSPLDESLEKARAATKLWRQARDEAHHGHRLTSY